MKERRSRRSSDRKLALQWLVESVADNGGAAAVVLVDQSGQVVAQKGPGEDVRGLSLAARDVACRRVDTAAVARATKAMDMTARRIATSQGPFYFAAVGDGVEKIGDLVRAVERIVKQA